MNGLRKLVQEALTELTQNPSINSLEEGHYTTWKKLNTISEDIGELEIKEKEIVQKLAKHFSLRKMSSIGSGTQGIAYYIPNNRVLKLTTDRSEVAEAYKIKGKKLKHLSNIYETYTLGGKYEGFYVIISELLDKTDDIDDAYNYLEIFFRNNSLKSPEYIFTKYSLGSIPKEEVNKITKKIKAYYEPYKSDLAIWFMKGMFGIIDELKKYKIQSTDWVVPNLGIKKSGELAMYDFGHGDTIIPSGVKNINLNESFIAKAKKFSDLTDDELIKIAKWGLQSDFSLSGCWDDSNDDIEIASRCVLDDFKNSLKSPYPQGLNDFPSEPIIYRFITAKNKESINTNNLGFSWFADPNQHKTNTEFFGSLLHLRKKYRDKDHKLFLIAARVPISKIDITRTLWQRSANWSENEIVLKDDSNLIVVDVKDMSPELGEGNLVFVQPSQGMEYPDFFDGQNNPLFNSRAYPPARNFNDHPLSEEEEIIEERKRISDETVSYLLNKMKAFDAKYINSGGYGDAYEHNGKVIKFTTDFQEAKLAQKFSRHKFKHIANIEKVVRYQESPDKWIYIITLEKLNPLSEGEIKIFRLYEKSMGAYGHYIHDSKSKESFEQVINNIKAPQYAEFFDTWVVRDVYLTEKSIINMYHQIKELKDEVSKVMGASEVEKYLTDFHPGNIGKKSDGSIAFFDLKWEFKKPPTDLRTIKEMEISPEELNKKQLPYKNQDLFDDYVLEKTEAEIREIAPTLDLNQRPDLLIKTIETKHPELFDNFAEWLSNKIQPETTLNESDNNMKKISWIEAAGLTSQSDVVDVSQWMKKPMSKLNFFLTSEPISMFANTIKEMESTYDEFLDEQKRTEKIYHMLRHGAKPKPIFIELNDDDKFIMEGRHRIVAFSWMKLEKVPVIYVSYEK